MKKIVVRLLMVVLVLLGSVVVILAVRHTRAVTQIEREWASVPTVDLGDLDTTSRLEILPLYEEAGDTNRFQVGHGVSYLIKTDHATILMDVGNNAGKQDLAPFRQNMKALGVTWEEIDVIVISHAHPDHLGGLDAWRQNTLALGKDSVDLSDKQIYVPVPLSYGDAETTVATDPTVIAPGVATTGVIPYPEVFPLSLFNPRGAEQALVVNVAGKGLVLITGCGHPTLERLVTRSETLFDLPVVGVAGGLHYEGADAATVEPHVKFLETRQPVLVALSPHDNGPAAIQAFRSAFADVYQKVEVGKTILLTD